MDRSSPPSPQRTYDTLMERERSSVHPTDPESCLSAVFPFVAVAVAMYAAAAERKGVAIRRVWTGPRAGPHNDGGRTGVIYSWYQTGNDHAAERPIAFSVNTGCRTRWPYRTARCRRKTDSRGVPTGRARRRRCKGPFSGTGTRRFHSRP